MSPGSSSIALRRFFALAASACVIAGCERAAPTGETTPTDALLRFAVFGDAPYHGFDFPRYSQVLKQLDRAELDVVIHVGDLLWYPCDEKTYRNRLEGFQRLRHPLVYTPGDNEWADCHEEVTGSHLPLERLAKVREVFFDEPSQSLGGRTVALQSQGESADFSEFVENARWRIGDVVFATVHFPGSWNAGAIFPARSEADDKATRRRTAAAVAWIQQAFAAADHDDARALVLATHADLNLTAAPDDDYQRSYAPFVERLEALVADADFPVLLVHGDSHEYTADQPLRDRRNGRALDNFWRLQVMGAPDIGWAEVAVTGDPDAPFEFTAHDVPWWKLF